MVAATGEASTHDPRADVPVLVAIIVVGGIVGPILMLAGLRSVSGVAGALLLNLETVFTILFAVTVFRERLSRREAIAAAIVILGALAVSYSPGAVRVSTAGALAIAGACAAWGLDNNLTRLLSRRDPVRLVQIKTLGAGGCNLLLATAVGGRFHQVPVGAALLIGFFCYGLSIVFDVLALRYLGAAREAAFFATAPFIGALVAAPLLGESLRPVDIAGGLLMATGMVTLLATGQRT